MTPEEMDRKMEFILDTLARNSSDIARNSIDIGALQQSMVREQEAIADLRKLVADTNAVLIESMKLEDARVSRIDETMAQLAAAQRRTDERLNALMNIVERHITSPGHSQPIQ